MPSASNQPFNGSEDATPADAIAVIGIGCRLPGGVVGPASFWQLLKTGVDAISEVPEDRWSSRFFLDPNARNPGRMYARYGGFISGLDLFDPQFFGLAPREAAFMDPQQRLLLEVVWEAFEDAGLVPESLSGSRTGVFVGISTHDFGDIQQKDIYTCDFYANTGGALSIAANRVSYLFDLLGPSMAVDTACSSSLVAVDLACRSLREGTSDLAVAGGVNCMLSPETTMSFSKGSMLSPDGRCKAFDARANGYVRGEGAGVLILKPLRRALSDGDDVYAVIIASGVNQDGRTHGMTVPSRAAQERLLLELYDSAHVSLDQVVYLEAHGTGTPVGDPIEAAAIGGAIARRRRPGSYLTIGSVKSNIGHLEAASGIAGTIKAALILKERCIPPSLHFEEPNPRIAFDDLRLRVPRACEEVQVSRLPAVVGVNSFGFGGTNAHVVLQSAPDRPRREPRPSANGRHSRLVPVTARSPAALLASASNLADFLVDTEAGRATPFEDVCHTVAVRRSHFEHRATVVASSSDELVSALRAMVVERQEHPPSVDQPSLSGKLAFVFSGMGPQWAGMGRELMSEPVFRGAAERCDRLFREHAGWSLLAAMSLDPPSSRMQDAEVAQPANFLLQMGLAELWASWGVTPEAIIGHSAGEVAAAVVAGVLSLDAGVRVIYHRSRLQQRATNAGRMLAAGLSVADAEEILAPYLASVSIAAINGPTSVTLSGDAGALAAVEQLLTARGIFNRALDVNVPYHSHHMDSLEAELRASLQSLEAGVATVPFYSTVSGTALVGPEVNASYWWDNVRQPVRFAAAMQQLIADGYDRFVELGPHPVLAHSIREALTAGRAPGVALPSLRRGRERATALESLGTLYSHGHTVNWPALLPATASLVKLPTYPWQKTRFWHESETSRHHRLADPTHPLLHRRVESPEAMWETNLAPTMPPYLKDHVIQGSVVYPAAAYIEMALAAARQLGCNTPVIEDLELKRALVLVKDAVTELRFGLDQQQSGFAIHSRSRESGQPWTLHAVGHLRLKRGVPARTPENLTHLRERCPAEMSRPSCYTAMQEHGLQYGPTFQGLTLLWQGRGEALGRIECPEAIAVELAAYCVHPAVLDACFHVLMGAILINAEGQTHDGTYLPVEMGRIRFHQALTGSTVWSHARVTHRSATHLAGDLSIFDDHGHPVMEITSFTCQRVPDPRPSDAWTDYLYEPQWFATSLPVPHRTFEPAALPAPSSIARTLTRATTISRRFDRQRHYEEVEPRIEALCGAYALSALKQLGWKPRKGERADVASLASCLGIVEQHHRLLGRLLEMLAEDGYLKASRTGWTVVHARSGGDVESAWDELVKEHPDYEGVRSLISRCGGHLADVLAGRQEPMHSIVPDGSMSRAEHFYSESPYSRVYNHLVSEILARAVQALPTDGTTRILEIGAGTAGTTVHVLPVLPRQRTEYVFTDVSTAFVAHGQQTLHDHPWVRFRVLDIERSPAEQGFVPHSFDMVIAAGALHATKDLRASLEHVRQLLRPGGLLVLLELIRQSRYFDLSVGLLKDWWRYEDESARGGPHAWVSRSGWQRLLEEAGFDDATSVSDVNRAGEPLQAVLLARVRDDATRSVVRSSSPVARGQRWLILGDGGKVGRGLSLALEAHGAEAIVVVPGASLSLTGPGPLMIRPDNPDDSRALLASVGRDLHGIVHLWNLDVPEPDDAGVESLEMAQRLGCLSVLNLVQAVATTGQGNPPRLWIVTRGAQQMPGEVGSPHIAQAPVWGLGRVIANEHPPLRCTLVDLDPSEDAAIADALWREISVDDVEQEVGVRTRGRFVARLVGAPRTQASDGSGALSKRRRASGFLLEASRPGALDSLVLRETTRRRPRAREVELRVSAAGLNFRDVMKAMGLYPTEGGRDAWLGDECAGTVVRVGSGVEGIRPGDRVVAFSSGTLRNFVTAPVAQVRPLPAAFNMEEAAASPIVFLTVLYALKHLARLSQGERILIHAAAGGVGLAAIQYAQHLGAEIFATAGSAEKRDYLRSLGVRHVLDSRSHAFADDILKITGGQGVSVVLNSLAGEFIPNSLSVLEPSGRFVELGKIDIYQDAKLGLGQFKNGRSFFAVDLGWLMMHRPQHASELFGEVMELVASGTFRPLPVTTFPIVDAAAAFRHMAQAKHIGKIALSVPERVDSQILPSTEKAPLVSGRATYLVTGGLSGFGLSISQWLVQQGARHLVLVGRRGVTTPESEETVQRLSSLGVQVKVASVDVTCRDQVNDLVDEVSRTMAPLRGVFHAAMVLDDGYLLQLNESRFARVMAPKVAGTWNLHQATSSVPLDYFVLFSSISSLTGALGQGNYCAANAFMDAFAHYRRALKLPALTVNWGAIGDVGYVARNADVGRYLERQGLEGLGHLEAKTILDGLLRSGRSQVAAIKADFAKLAAFAPSTQWTRRLSLIPANASSQDALRLRPDRGTLLNQLRTAPAPQRAELLQAVLKKALANVLKISADSIEPHQAISALGLDSLMAVEFEFRIKSEVSADVSIGFLAAGDSTLKQLTDRLLEQIVGAEVTTALVSEARFASAAG